VFFFVSTIMSAALKTTPAAIFGWLSIVAAAVLVYWPGLSGGFAFDDYHVIVNNEHLGALNHGVSGALDAAFSTATGPLKRPLSLLTFALNHAVDGLVPLGFKVTNLALHCLNAGLLLFLLRAILGRLSGIRAGDAGRLAWLIALLWAVHPINLTSVLYVVQRMTLLASTFMLLGMWVYFRIRVRQTSGRDVTVATWLALMLCWVLGLAAKETAVLLPFFLLTIELSAFGFAGLPPVRAAWRGIAGGLILVSLGVAYMNANTLFPAYFGREFTAAERLLTESRVLMLYLQMILTPDLSLFALFHDDVPLSKSLLDPISTLPSVCVVLVAVGCTFARRPLWLAFGCAWFISGHLLESSLVPLELVHEHRNYLASVGPLSALVIGAQLILKRVPDARLRYLPMALFIVCVAIVTALRAVDWDDPWRQMSVDIRHHPESARSWYEYGRLSFERGAELGDATLQQTGVDALERSATLDRIPFMALAALLKLRVNANDQTGTQVMLDRLKAHPRSRVRVEAFRQLVECQAYSSCRKAPGPVLALAEITLTGAELYPDYRRRTLEWLAIYYLAVLGDAEAGLTILAELVAHNPTDLNLSIRLAEAYSDNGGRALAIKLGEALLNDQPWHFELTNRPHFGRLRRLLAGPTEL
jgi:protein O-mannosyl-transferase